VSLALFADPLGHVRDCHEVSAYQLNKARVPDAIISAQRVEIIEEPDSLPDVLWMHVFAVPSAVVAECGDLDLEHATPAVSRALRLYAIAAFYLSHHEARRAIASAAFDYLYSSIITRPELHAEGAKLYRHDQAAVAGKRAGKAHSARGKQTDRNIEAAWAKLGARGVPERGRSKVIASDLEIDQTTVNKRVKVLNLRAK